MSALKVLGRAGSINVRKVLWTCVELGLEVEREERPGVDVQSDAARRPGQDGDVLVVTQKIVSKAEGRLVPINADDPLSHKVLVEEEARRVVRRRGDLIITETKHGFICANSGIDASNVGPEGVVCLLPEDPDNPRLLTDSNGVQRWEVNYKGNDDGFLGSPTGSKTTLDVVYLAPALKRAVAVVKQGMPALVDVVCQPR